jgi:hypothetical protein
MTTLRIPVEAGLEAHSVGVFLESVSYEFMFRWNKRDQHWYMNIVQNGVVSINGIKVLNSSDLLAQFAHMSVDERIPPGTLRVFDTDNLRRDPDTSTFGESVLLLYDEAA